MDYAIMSGGDVGPLGEDAVSQLHGLFRWASRSRRGLLLFVDEAEAFLSARGRVNVVGADDTHVRHALNALLYQTGTGSRSFMLVLATNRPEDLDPAVLDRMDVSLFLGLPAQPQRVSLVRLYMEAHLLSVARKTQRRWWPLGSRYTVEEVCSSDEKISEIAKRCGGFSGREIAKLFIACQYTMIMAAKGALTYKLLDETIVSKINEHAQKMGFSAPSPKLEATGTRSARLVTTSSKTKVPQNSVDTDTDNEGTARKPSTPDSVDLEEEAVPMSHNHYHKTADKALSRQNESIQNGEPNGAKKGCP
jgi:ATPase family AAA domain-containing protein 3A/B